MKAKNHSNGFDVGELIASLPAGLERAILRSLSYHQGRQNAILRADLVSELGAVDGLQVHDRQVRMQINLLRKRGVPICSTGGSDGGYWLGANMEEVAEFIESELSARIADLAETRDGMLRGARERWGSGGGVQPRLL